MFRKAKAAMLRGNTAEHLESALAELRKLKEAQQAAAKEADRVLATVTTGIANAQQAMRESWQAVEAGDPKALQAYFLAQLVLEKGREMSGGLQRQHYMREEQVPEPTRGVLDRVAQCRLEAIEQKRERLFDLEQKRLDTEYGAGAYDAADSQVIKALDVRIETLKTRLQRIRSNEPVSQLWIAFSDALLNDE
jgi:hypothetical protein